MIKAITFIPASGGTESLTYVERASRNRSLHVLLQDYSFKGKAAAHPAARRNFLRNAYREIISRYVSFGRIEHPLPLARSLVSYLESLSKRVDCRVEDFRGIGFYALFQDGGTFYLLASREGKARMRTDRGFESLSAMGPDGVSELPVESAHAQKELFSRDLKDFLTLYKIEPSRHESDGGFDLSVGGSGEEMDTLLEALDQPGVVEAGVPEKTIPLNLISHKMMYVRFDGLVPNRDLYDLEFARLASSKPRGRVLRYAFSAVTVLAFVSLGAVWLSARLSRAPESTQVVQSQPAERDGVASSDPGGNPAESQPMPSVDDAGAGQFRLTLAWKKSYSQPVTSTPRVEGDRVVFGGRDRHLYALDRLDGSVVWKHRAQDGIGASPAVSGGLVVAADYEGNVFAVGLEDGRRRWNRKLPRKVVSSPSVGNGEVLVGCFNGTAYALSAETGRVLWRLSTGGRIRASSAWSDGLFYVPSYDGNLYAVTAGTGTVRWKRALGGPVASAPAVEGGGVAVGGANGVVYGLDAATGAIAWRFQTGGDVKSAVALVGGMVYVGSNDNSLYCLDAAKGALVWKFETGGPVLARPAAVDEHVVFASYDGFLYCLEAQTGSLVDRFDTEGAVFSSPTIGGGHAFFGNNDGRFYCLNLQGKESS